MTETIPRLARGLEAQGVESPARLAMPHERGCDIAQGVPLGRPWLGPGRARRSRHALDTT
ncbi:hypothetical protein E0493_22575 [Roseomonas sp. M0104]|uniref:EAL domain-containing protein n=1 Tax=Teichococcus coralli TaxID=2545983 RepID=A0A845BLJ6_9PROT|nr:hypothetical protein [Pseudoroseomonas coralli]MXP66127.1 hypothetical protein [Pseudoroseomonas coralli]